MRIQQLLWDNDTWQDVNKVSDMKPQLILLFGGSQALSVESYMKLRELYPSSHIAGCTTAGEILEDEVLDDSVVATAIEFSRTVIRVSKGNVNSMSESGSVGKALADQLMRDDLRAVFLISDGNIVNGSELVNGVASSLPDHVIITGGLAGDGDRFERTLVVCDDIPKTGVVLAIGFYGDAIKVGHGSVGGWDSFGPKRVVSKSKSNVLYELDHKPALDLYKKYLGEDAERLPASALLFPLMIYDEGSELNGVVRTILGTDEKEGTMTFAGDIPEGSIAQLMMANFDRLIDGASAAARNATIDTFGEVSGDRLGILISCVGRKMVLGQRIGDEIEAVREIIGPDTFQTGFYSYGEISPHNKLGSCELHNQTMTITMLGEDA